jgi:RNA polymerase sigma-70 factor (ECF subfamily)
MSPDQPKGTLGDLLYADSASRPVPESEWVGLVRSMAAGDQAALRALYDRTYRIVFTVVIRITNNRETAEEVTLDVFHDVWRRASRYDPAGGPVVGWIVNQARSRALDRVRYDHRKKRVQQHEDSPLPRILASHPDEVSELEEQGRRLRAALTLLRSEEREVIETAFFSESTYEEVARQLGQPLGTVKTRIRSGLMKLRHALSPTTRAS